MASHNVRRKLWSFAVTCTLLQMSASGPTFAQSAVPTVNAAPSPAESPTPTPEPGSTLPENPNVTATAKAWVRHIQSMPAKDLRGLMLRDGPVLVLAAAQLATLGDPIDFVYARGDGPGQNFPLNTYVYSIRFKSQTVREILMIDNSGGVHQVFFIYSHPRDGANQYW